MPPIPTIDTLDGAWFTNAFRTHGVLPNERSVVSVHAMQIGEGAGLMSLVWPVALARFHARWWGAELSDLATTFIPMDDGFNQFVVPALHQQSWPAAREARPDLWPAEVSTFLDGFVAKVPQILEGIMGSNTLTHNDYRVDNLLWDGDEVVVLDRHLAAVRDADALALYP